MSGDPIAVFANLRSNVARHATFLHYVLGEPWWHAALMAECMRDEPISESDMRYVAAHWWDEELPPLVRLGIR